MSPEKKEYDPATREKLDQVDEEEWQDALSRVLDYARYKTRFLSLLDYRIDSVELVREAIARAYGAGTGKFCNITYRNWNQDKYPSLSAFLKSVVKSLVGHIIEENAGLHFLPIIAEDAMQTGQVEALIQHQSPSETPETILLNAERASELIGMLEEIANSDEEIGMFLLAVDAGYSRAAYQAKETGYDVTQIYNIRKRLRRKLDAFFDKLDK